MPGYLLENLYVSVVIHLRQSPQFIPLGEARESADEIALRLVKDSTRKAQKRALETSDETLSRQEQDRACKAKRRETETVVETAQRRQQDRACKTKRRESETMVETAQRRQRNRACKAKTRESETVMETAQRQEQNRACMATRRALIVPVEKCIRNFHSKVKQGPEFVCICCHRLMYKQTVIPCTGSKYTKASNELLMQVFSAEHNYISSDGKQWICKTCDAALKRGNMPLQAKANGLQLCPIPNQLSGLNMLELRLICLRVPFMKMVALPSGKQRCIHGPAVNVPSKVDTICTVLPRLPSETELIPLKLKRKLAYRGHYMYDYISPEKVLTALRWLKQNNPLYADIDINEQWLEQAVSNDEDLFGGLVEQCDTNDLDSDIDNVNSKSVLATQQPHNEPGIDNGDSSSNQVVDKEDNQGMECHPYSLSIDDDVFTIAFNLLEQVAREMGLQFIKYLTMVIACLAA